MQLNLFLKPTGDAQSKTEKCPPTIQLRVVRLKGTSSPLVSQGQVRGGGTQNRSFQCILHSVSIYLFTQKVSLVSVRE